MHPTASVLVRVVVLSSLLPRVASTDWIARSQSRLTAPACDTLAVPGSGLITLVAVGPNGAIAWTEGSRATEVRVRGAGGELQTIGRNGGGPGEFRSITALGWRRDTLWSYDNRLRRAQGFVRGTALLRAVPIARSGSFLSRDDTSFIGSVSEVATPDHPVEIGSSPLTVGIVVPATGATHMILSITPTKPTDVSVLPGFSPFGIIRSSQDASLWCITARGADDATQLACSTSGGREVLRRQEQLAPHQVPIALWDSSVRLVAEQIGVPVGEVVKQFTRSRTLTAAFDLLINGRSEIWLLRSPPAEATASWERLAVSGRRLTPISLPSRLQLRALDGDIAYAADTDADGLQALVRCRLGLCDHGP